MLRKNWKFIPRLFPSLFLMDEKIIRKLFLGLFLFILIIFKNILIKINKNLLTNNF